MKNVVDWTAKDAQDFLASYDNSFDTFTYKGFVVSYNTLTNRWRAFDDFTWQPLLIDFATPDEARLHIDEKNM
jgi:hypothetical protein